MSFLWYDGLHFRRFSREWWGMVWTTIRRWCEWSFCGWTWFADPADLWILVTVRGLKEYRKNLTGCSFAFIESVSPGFGDRAKALQDTEAELNAAMVEWERVVDKVIQAFELHVEYDGLRSESTCKALDESKDCRPPAGCSSWMEAHEVVKDGFGLWWRWWESMWG